MIIFLHGPDTFRSLEKLDQIKQKFIKEVDKSSLNIEILDGSKLITPDFDKAISTQPFLAKKRLVIIKNLITKNKGQKIQKEILDVLHNKNLESVVLVFWEEGELDKKATRSKITTQRSSNLNNFLKESGLAQEFSLLNESQTKNFITTKAKELSITINPDATDLLWQICSNNLWQINNELKKLAAFSKDKSVTKQNVEDLVQTKIDDDIFELTNALGLKNKPLALKLISDQIKSGTSAIELLSKITWQFKNLLLIKSFIEENGPGYPVERIGSKIGLHPFVIKKTSSQARNYNLADLKKSYQHLIQIDRKLKTSQVDPEVLFDLFVVKS